MQSGRLRELVKIQEKTIARDAYGAEITTWADVASVWASVLPRSSGERFVTGAVQEIAQISHAVRIRYRAGITAEMRIVWGTRHLYVQTITDPDGRRRELILMCEEVQP